MQISFWFWKRFKFASNEDANQFFFLFFLKKRYDNKQIFEKKKKKKDLDNKKIKNIFQLRKYRQHMIWAFKKSKLNNHLFIHHLIKRDRRRRSKGKLPLAWMFFFFFFLREYFRVQRNLCNYLWNLKFIAYKKEIFKAKVSRTSLT